MNALGPYLDADTVFVDVGSNVGWYTFHMARTHQVEAFEPFLKNLQLQNPTRCLHPDIAQNIRPSSVWALEHDEALRIINTRSIFKLHQIPTVNHGDTHTACDPVAH